jgi:hypothetical protein
MKTRVIQGDPDEAPASATAVSPPARRPERRMTGGRIALLAVGVVLALLGLASLAAGAALLVGNETERDAAGFFSTATHSFRADSHAIVSENLDVGTDGPDWLLEEGRLATIRVSGSNADSARELFIGVARSADVRRYLAGTRYSTLVDFEIDPSRATYRDSSGSAAPAEPGSQGFWSEFTEGSATQSLEWDVAKGDWSFVVMNGDASSGVSADLSLGAKVPFVFWLGVGLAIGGAILLAGAAAMIYFSARRPVGHAGAPATAPAA